jgi:hypothetical protein
MAPDQAGSCSASMLARAAAPVGAIQRSLVQALHRKAVQVI